MALVTNLTNVRLCISGKGANGLIASVGIAPHLDKDNKVDEDSSKEIDDAIVKHWVKSAGPARMVETKVVEVEYSDPGNGKRDKTIQHIEAMTDSAELEEMHAEAKEHWKQKIQRIESMTDPAELEKMHADDKCSKAVKSAIENRFLELD